MNAHSRMVNDDSCLSRAGPRQTSHGGRKLVDRRRVPARAPDRRVRSGGPLPSSEAGARKNRTRQLEPTPGPTATYAATVNKLAATVDGERVRRDDLALG